MKLKNINITELALATLLTVSSASATTVAVEQYLNIGISAGTGTANLSFDTVTADNSVLFIAIGSEVHSFANVTFNGVTLTTPFESNDVGNRESLIFAFDLGNEIATTGQTVVINATDTLGGNSGYGVTALQVSNADFSSLAGSSSGGGNITVPTLAAGSLILDVIGSNAVGTLTPDGLSRTGTVGTVGMSSAAYSSSYISNTTGGGDIGWTGESGGSNSAIWIEAAAIPEPSTMMLSGLGLLGFCLRRRRS